MVCTFLSLRQFLETTENITIYPFFVGLPFLMLSLSLSQFKLFITDVSHLRVYMSKLSTLDSELDTFSPLMSSERPGALFHKESLSILSSICIGFLHWQSNLRSIVTVYETPPQNCVTAEFLLPLKNQQGSFIGIF